MSGLPTGTVTFLFTDIEGSTQLLKRLGPTYAGLLTEHQEIVRAATSAHGGREVDTQGDSFFVAFPRAKDAVAAAVAIQRDLAAHAWPEGGDIKVRIGLHTGEPQVGEDRYVGMGVNKAARIAAAGHGGQVLLSRTTLELVEDELPTGVTIRDLGERRLKDIERPERISQLVIEGLPSDFAQLKTLDVELARKRRRIYAGAAVIGVVAAAVAIPVFALGQGSGSGANVEPNSVAVIDPISNRVVDSAPVGVDPEDVTGGANSVWVANTADATVSRIDPTTRRTVATIPVGDYPSDVAVAAGSAWVAVGPVQVRRIDLARNEADEQLCAVEALLIDGSCPTYDCARANASLTAGGGWLWWACWTDDSADVSRIGPRRRRAVRVDEALVGSSPVLPQFVDVAFGFGSVWIADREANSVVQIAGDTLRKVREISVGRGAAAVAVGFESVWVANSEDDTVSRIGTAALETGLGETTQVVAEPIPVGDAPVDVAVGEDAVWVVNRGDRTISRIDPQTNEVAATVELENEPVRVAAGDGYVWVTVQEAEEPA